MTKHRFHTLIATVILALTLSACGGQPPAAAPTPAASAPTAAAAATAAPAATDAPAPTAAAAAATAAPAPTQAAAAPARAYTDADLTQAVVFDLMESRIKLSLPAWKAANYDLSKRLANVANQYTFVEFALKSKQADTAVKSALDVYIAVSDKAGDEAQVTAAHMALLDALTAGRQAVFSAQLADPKFQAELVFRLLTWTSDTFVRNASATGDALAYPYQRAYGYEQAAKARFATIASSAPDGAAITAQFSALDASFPAATPASLNSAEVGTTIGAIQAALQKSFSITTPAASSSNLIEYALRGTQTGVDLYKAGKAGEAYQAMADGYLNGFEFIEGALDTKDKEFRTGLESKFTDIRNSVRSGKPVADIEALLKDINAGMVIAGDLLSGKISGPINWALAPTPAPAAAAGPTPTAAASAPVSAALQGLRDARDGMNAALAKYKEGQADEAYELAAAAYLNGFENSELELAKKDRTMMEGLEVQFKSLRDGIKANSPAADIEAIVKTISDNLDKAEKLLQ